MNKEKTIENLKRNEKKNNLGFEESTENTLTTEIIVSKLETLSESPPEVSKEEETDLSSELPPEVSKEEETDPSSELSPEVSKEEETDLSSELPSEVFKEEETDLSSELPPGVPQAKEIDVTKVIKKLKGKDYFLIDNGIFEINNNKEVGNKVGVCIIDGKKKKYKFTIKK